METFSMLLVLCEGNPPVTGGFPSQKASNGDLWWVDQALDWPVIRDAMTVIWRRRNE